jgi:predicted MFS family arabinose efflux permease
VDLPLLSAENARCVAQPQPHAHERAREATPRATAYSWYVVALLTLVYVSNHVDRLILAVVIRPIKQEFDVSDTMMGLLAGPAFAAFYTLVGLPVARWADRGNRRSIIALGLAIWSGMTALAGTAQSFVQLALARIGVAIGEAAGSPPAHSLISDYFPPQSRGRALGIYAGGLHLAGPIGLIGGAWIAQHYGWRSAFLAFGIPGLLLALLVRTTIREPVRGRMDAAPPPAPARSWSALRGLFAKGSYFYLQFGGTLHALAGYGVGIWIYEFMSRVHGMPTTEAALRIGIINFGFGLAGVALGGWLTDRLAPGDARWFLWLPALQAAVGAPFVALFLYLDQLGLALACYCVYWVLNASYNAPIYALMQNLASARSRALAVATHLFIVNAIGLSAGPFLIGYLNDAFQPAYGERAIRYSLILVGLVNGLAAIFYLAGARSVRQDVADAQRA